jgi:hypothetical protein
MRHVLIRVVQLALLVLSMIAATPRHAAANELACYVICIYDDWQCILQTGHPADECGYDKERDICNLGGCSLGAIAS